MHLCNIVLLALLSATLPTIVHAGPVKIHCEHDWPSESLEKCQYEGEEWRPKDIGSRNGRRDPSGLANATYLDDIIHMEGEVTTNNMMASRFDLNGKPEKAEGDGVTPRGVAGGPTWPNKWTKLPCCQLTCACWKYLTTPENMAPKEGSEGRKKAQCCYQHMIKDPACAHAPAFKRFKPIQPPWCLN